MGARLPRPLPRLQLLLLLGCGLLPPGAGGRAGRKAARSARGPGPPPPPPYKAADYDAACAEPMDRHEADPAAAAELWPPAFGLPAGAAAAGNWTAAGGGGFAASGYWGRRPLWVRRAAAGGGGGVYGGLLTLAGLDRAIAANPAAMVYGRGIKFAREGQLAQLGDGKTIDAQTARDGFSKHGATVVVNEFERIHRPVKELAERIEAEFGMFVSSNLYVTPPAARGFDPHFDYEDSFIVQVLNPNGRRRRRRRRPAAVPPAVPHGCAALLHVRRAPTSLAAEHLSAGLRGQDLAGLGAGLEPAAAAGPDRRQGLAAAAGHPLQDRHAQARRPAIRPARPFPRRRRPATGGGHAEGHAEGEWGAVDPPDQHAARTGLHLGGSAPAADHHRRHPRCLRQSPAGRGPRNRRPADGRAGCRAGRPADPAG